VTAPARAGHRGGLANLASRPRVDLVLGPTPLHPAPRLSRELGVPVLFKRDDLTGRGLGGNKLRGLEYILADALGQGCDCLVTGAGPQSNWTMLAALSCLRCQIEPHVVCYGTEEASGGKTSEGNMRLHRWLGVDVRFTGSPDRSSVDAGIEAAGAELRAAGRHPYLVPRGGATPLGALGYVRASTELAAQLAALGEQPAGLWLAAGSCGTQAGLQAGAALTDAPYRVRGVTVSRPVPECRDRVRALAADAAALAAGEGTSGEGAAREGAAREGTAREGAAREGTAREGTAREGTAREGTAREGTTREGTTISEPEVLGGWIGPGYGVPSAEGQAAARLVAQAEGVFLDPVFGAKAMAALIAECRAERVRGPQIFLVGGGAPTLFAGAGL
jgi:D-cysteine desulfhydrase